MPQDREGLGEVLRTIEGKLARIVPPVLLIGSLIAVWWIVVANSESPIFPTPAQVATGAWALAEDGTLWQHIEASLFRVEIGFGLAFLRSEEHTSELQS